MNTAGMVVLGLGAAACLAGVVLPLVGRRWAKPSWSKVGAWSLYAFGVLAVVAASLLLAALLTRDFSNAYVFQHSSRGLSAAYTVSAFWAGNAGSLLLWLLMLAAFAAVAVRGSGKRESISTPYLVSVMGLMGLFFSLLILFGPGCNPFVSNAVVPTPDDGLGLSPALQSPGMVLHPLAIYIGFVAMAPMFGVMVSGLAGGGPLQGWLGSVRRWALVGWVFLTLGNVVGAWWAYVTLGWGGYWAWDPVENVSLIPWLTATALLHTTSAARRWGRQQRWVVVLAAATFLLTIFGTLITRTGVATSVHDYTESDLVVWFVTYLVFLTILASGVIVWRRGVLRGGSELAPASVEGGSLFSTVAVLSALAFLVFWGVVFPLLADVLAEREVVLGSGYFDSVAGPLGLVLLLLLAICSLFGFSGGSRRRWVIGVGAAGVVAVAILVVLLTMGARKGYPVAGYVLAGAAFVGIILKGGRRRRSRSSYGALLTHLGLVILVAGLIGSWSFRDSVEGRLIQDETLELDGVSVGYQDVEVEDSTDLDRQVSRAVLSLSIEGEDAGLLEPSLEYYPRSGRAWPRVARHTSATGDIYVTLLGFEDGVIDLRLERHPLILWLWIGGGVMGLGGLLALLMAGRGPSAANELHRLGRSRGLKRARG